MQIADPGSDESGLVHCEKGQKGSEAGGLEDPRKGSVEKVKKESYVLKLERRTNWTEGW